MAVYVLKLKGGEQFHESFLHEFLSSSFKNLGMYIHVSYFLFQRFPPGIPEDDRPELQDQLTRLIIRILASNPDLHYFQGYHDVAITFLLVVGEEMAFNILQKLSNGPWLRE